MDFKTTEEQDNIIENINDGKNNILVVSAYSGASKSSSVIAALNHNTCKMKSALIIAFNSKISKENKIQFPKWCDVRTIHSLGYKYIISPGNLEVKNNTQPQDFKGKYREKDRRSILYLFNRFCASSSVDIVDFIMMEGCSRDKINMVYDAIKRLLSDSESGLIPCSHQVYIKLFQIKLHYGDIVINGLDFLFMDEFADVNECYYSIFCNIGANKKVASGDSNQSIYQFNHSIDGLSKLIDDYPDNTVDLSLSKSFRCSIDIARSVNIFCRNYIDKDFSFDGSEIIDDSLKTFAYLTRTNAELITEGISCMRSKMKFNFARNPNSILGPSIYIRSGIIKDYEEYINNGNTRHISDENISSVMEYSSYMDSTNQSNRKGFISYIINRNSNDSGYQEDLTRVAKLAKKFSLDALMKLLVYSKDKSNNSNIYTIGTAFSTKGSTYDAVYICDDINSITLNEIEEEDGSSIKSNNSEKYLAYVACTRARVLLVNAEVLDTEMDGKNPGSYYDTVNGAELTYTDFKKLVNNSYKKTNRL